ncbi:oxaloacetate decarboxylase [Faecalibacterium sp. Marseille-P9312]|nr:oxaloacetate decarboxylase [Faecalibacterium sp. Marseille-P9312]
MLHLTSWMTTLPIMVIGMVSIVLIIGVIVLAVMFLNKLTSRK